MNQHMTTADHLAAIEPAEVGVARPTFSITILNYNYGRYLPICLDSILNQTFEDFEILLINDSSTDDSLEVIAPYLRDPRITLIDHTTNKGYVASLVEGCEKSRGEFISVISADDWVLDPTAFAQAYHALLSDPSIVMCYSAWHEMDDIGTIRHTRRSKDRDYVADGVEEFRRLILSSPVLHSGTLIRRSAYQQVGGYDTRCRYSVDTNLWLALCAVGKVAYINTPLYAYRAHATNMSNTAGSFWRATEEMLIGIDAAMALFPPATLPDARRLRRQGLQRALVAVPTLDIFAGRLRRGWRGFFTAVQHYPVLTVAQPRTLSLVARSLLGQQSYERLRLIAGAFAQRFKGGVSHA